MPLLYKKDKNLKPRQINGKIFLDESDFDRISEEVYCELFDSEFSSRNDAKEIFESFIAYLNIRVSRENENEIGI